MASQIQLTRSGISGVQPAASELEYGELALNYADGKLFYRDEADNLKAVNDTYQNSNNTIYVNSINSEEPKIGLNTTSPEFLLDLGGDTGSAYNTLRINQTTGGTAIRIGSDGVGANGEDIALLRVDNADGETTSGADGFSIKYLGSNSDNELAIFTDNGSSQLQALTILQNGNVGIGVAAPDVKLDVAGSAAVANQLLIGDEWDTNTPAGGDKIYIKDTEGAIDYDPLGTATDGENNTTSTKDEFPLLISVNNDAVGNPTSHGILLYNSSGNAGTFAPSILFGSRESSAEASGQYRTTTGGIYCRSPLGVGGATDGHYGDGELIFATAGTVNGSTTTNSQGLAQRMVIDRSGRVGINNTAPNEVLDVSGNAYVSGVFTAGGTIQTTSGIDINSGGNVTATDVTASGDITATGNVIAATPTADTHLTTKAYVDAEAAVVDARVDVIQPAFYTVEVADQNNYTHPAHFATTAVSIHDMYSRGTIDIAHNSYYYSSVNSLLYTMNVKVLSNTTITWYNYANDDGFYIYVDGTLEYTSPSNAAQHTPRLVEVDLLEGNRKIEIVKNDSGSGSNRFELFGNVISSTVQFISGK